MENQFQSSRERRLSNVTISFGISLAAATVFSALLVIAEEKIPTLRQGMQSAMGHHWITHSASAVLIFLLGGVVLTRMNRCRGPQISHSRLIEMIVCGILFSTLVIIACFLVPAA